MTVTLGLRGVLRWALLLGALLLTACSSAGSTAAGSGATAGGTAPSAPAASGSSSAPGGAAASGAASGAAGGSTAAGSTAGAGADTVIIKNFMFSPDTLTVAPGATVTVRNEDTVAHTLTDEADPKLFGTGDIAPGQSMTVHAPKQSGSYKYFCMIHQYMTGTLVVR
jgi:plastocyanin